MGTPVPGAEIKLGDDGEVLARGPMIMRGYRKDPGKTAEAIDSDGWLHTGDIGSLDAEAAAAFAERHGLPVSIAELASNPIVRSAIQEGVDAANATLSRVEQIKKFTVVGEVWEPGGDYLTPTTKLKRKPIAAGYADSIDEMYR
nr:AMP-binding protein [Nocardia huaxiensis]